MKFIAGTKVANLQLNCNQDILVNHQTKILIVDNNAYYFYVERGKIGIIAGIKSLHEWIWPDQGEDAGFVCARILPGIGKWEK